MTVRDTPTTHDGNTPRGAEPHQVSVARYALWQAVICAVITAVAGLLGAWLHGEFGESTSTSVKRVAGLRAQVTELKNDLYILVGNSLEKSLRYSEGKQAFAPNVDKHELEYSRLKRAVYDNMKILKADPTVLDGTIDFLAKQDQSWIAAHKARLSGDFQNIINVRLAWLKTARERLKEAEANWRPESQQRPYADVALPEAVWILRDTSTDRPTERVTDEDALNEEITLLQQSILKHQSP